MHLSPRTRYIAAGIVVVAIGVLAFLAFGSVGHTGTPRQQLEQWVRDTGLGPAVGTLRGDDAAIAEVVEHPPGHRGHPHHLRRAG